MSSRTRRQNILSPPGGPEPDEVSGGEASSTSPSSSALEGRAAARAAAAAERRAFMMEARKKAMQEKAKTVEKDNDEGDVVSDIVVAEPPSRSQTRQRANQSHPQELVDNTIPGDDNKRDDVNGDDDSALSNPSSSLDNVSSSSLPQDQENTQNMNVSNIPFDDRPVGKSSNSHNNKWLEAEERPIRSTRQMANASASGHSTSVGDNNNDDNDDNASNNNQVDDVIPVAVEVIAINNIPKNESQDDQGDHDNDEDVEEDEGKHLDAPMSEDDHGDDAKVRDDQQHDAVDEELARYADPRGEFAGGNDDNASPTGHPANNNDTPVVDGLNKEEEPMDESVRDDEVRHQDLVGDGSNEHVLTHEGEEQTQATHDEGHPEIKSNVNEIDNTQTTSIYPSSQPEENTEDGEDKNLPPLTRKNSADERPLGGSKFGTYNVALEEFPAGETTTNSSRPNPADERPLGRGSGSYTMSDDRPIGGSRSSSNTMGLGDPEAFGPDSVPPFARVSKASTTTSTKAKAIKVVSVSEKGKPMGPHGAVSVAHVEAKAVTENKSGGDQDVGEMDGQQNNTNDIDNGNDNDNDNDNADDGAKGMDISDRSLLSQARPPVRGSLASKRVKEIPPAAFGGASVVGEEAPLRGGVSSGNSNLSIYEAAMAEMGLGAPHDDASGGGGGGSAARVKITDLNVLSEKVVSKSPKQRMDAYDDLKDVLLTAAESGDQSVFSIALSMVRKAVAKESNMLAVDKALDLLQVFLDKAPLTVAESAVEGVVAGTIDQLKSKTATRDRAAACLILCVEVGGVLAVLEGLSAGIQGKQPKVAAESAKLLLTIMREFGPKVLSPAKLDKIMTEAMNHANGDVRRAALELIVEIHKWSPQLAKQMIDKMKLRPASQKEAEDSFALYDTAKAGGHVGSSETESKGDEALLAPPRITKYVRGSEIPTSTGPAAGGKGGAGKKAGGEIGLDYDPLADMPAVDVCGKLSSGWVEGVKSAKWSDRKARLTELCDAAAANAKISVTGNTHDVCALLKSVIAKDGNVVCVAEASRAADLLAKGARKDFNPIARQLLPALLSQLKERKPTVVKYVGDALDSFVQCGCLDVSEILDPVKDCMSDKMPHVRAAGMFIIYQTTIYLLIYITLLSISLIFCCSHNGFLSFLPSHSHFLLLSPPSPLSSI